MAVIFSYGMDNLWPTVARPQGGERRGEDNYRRTWTEKMSGFFGGWGKRSDALLENDGLGGGWEEDVAAGRRPPPFAPGSAQYEDYPVAQQQLQQQQLPARISPRPTVSPRPVQQVVYPRDGQANIYVQGNGLQQQPQVVVIRHEHTHVGASTAPEGVCCALLVFILGFTMPLLWLLACCQLGSPSRSVRFLSRCSMLAFVLTSTGLGLIIYHDLTASGKWPWDAECFFPWDPKCKYPPSP